MGTFVMTAVGPNSFHGRVLMMGKSLTPTLADVAALQEEPEDMPLQVKLKRVANMIVKFGSITATLLFIALFIKFLVQLHGSQLDDSGKGQQFVQILIISIIILVIAVLERLPLAVNLALAVKEYASS